MQHQGSVQEVQDSSSVTNPTTASRMEKAQDDEKWGYIITKPDSLLEMQGLEKGSIKDQKL